MSIVSREAEQRPSPSPTGNEADAVAILRPHDRGARDAEEWRAFCRSLLLRHGAILLRGFDITDIPSFERHILDISPPDPWMAYETERASPRTHLGSATYSSTEYHAGGTIFVHNECCNLLRWPLRIFFGCAVPAASGGATPICDMRRITASLPAWIKDGFRARGIRYTRNYGGERGVSLDYGFGTSDHDAISSYCMANGLSMEWLPGDRLRTRAVRPAFARHPLTGEELWFNYATFYSRGSREPRFARLLRSVPDDDLPFSVSYGDGTAIGEDVFDEIRGHIQAGTVTFDWRKGDLLAVDNMLAAHGRQPFQGQRSVWVAMTEETGPAGGE